MKKVIQKINSLLEKFKASEYVFMIVVPIIIGILGGFGAAALKTMIHFFQQILWGNEHYAAGWLRTILVPASGAFVVGLIIHFFSKEAKGHGVPEVMEAITRRGGVIRPRVVLSKSVASALTIASGGSVGREGPIIQVGSAIGSTMGQLFKLSRRRMQTLVGCGAAAGIAAAFNTPIAGAMFAVEILLGDFTMAQFSPIVLSSVTATVITRVIYGNTPSFLVPKYELVHPLELIPYALLGLAAGMVGILFIKVLYFMEDRFDAIKVPDFYKTCAGGILLGLMGLRFPEIFGIGYEAMNKAFQGNMEVMFLFALIFLKILASSITLGAGSSGGIFAPSLFMGAMTGGFFGNIVHKLFPAITAEPGAYALVAMSAVVGATTHAPITAILIIFEMTNDYKIILPLMIATIISLTTTKLLKGSIYTLKLMRRGIVIHGGRELNVLKAMTVKEFMRSSIEIIKPNTSLNELIEKFIKSAHSFVYIIDENGKIAEKISQSELSSTAPAYENLKEFVVAEDIATPNRLTVNEKDHLDYVMKEFAKENIDEIPVVSSSDPTKILGTIWRIDVISAYNKEILKRDLAGEVSHLMASSLNKQLVEIIEGLYLMEIEVPKRFIGKRIIDLDLRKQYGVDVILIKKGGIVSKTPARGTDKSGSANAGKKENDFLKRIPGGDYEFQADDNLLILGERKNVEYLANL